jgi:rare lipoprotein A
METLNMRYFAFAALAALSVAFVGAAPASASHSKCDRSDVACKKATKAHYKKKSAHYKSAHYKKEAHRKASYKKAHHKHYSKKAAYKASSKKRAVKTSGNYGGGSQGMASYYWQGQQTASGARFNPSAMTAAHRSLPFGTRVLVTNRNNGRSVTVTINDRGPFIKGRIIDLSKGAAGVIGMHQSGVAPVSIQVLGRG